MSTDNERTIEVRANDSEWVKHQKMLLAEAGWPNPTREEVAEVLTVAASASVRDDDIRVVRIVLTRTDDGESGEVYEGVPRYDPITGEYSLVVMEEITVVPRPNRPPTPGEVWSMAHQVRREKAGYAATLNRLRRENIVS